ncbi:MAG: hypothetical protein V7727_16180 [Sneathiella sp.]
MTSDSIQTLLKQRRELRDCLQELRKEVAGMHQNTEKMIGDALGENQTVPAVKTAAPQDALPDPATALKLIQKLTQAQKSAQGEDTLVAEVKAPQKTTPTESVVTAPKLGLENAIVTEPGTPAAPTTATENPIRPSKADVKALPIDADLHVKSKTSDSLKGPVAEKKEDEEALEIDSLLNHAILLADFFLHHPSSAGNEQLNKLDAAISQIQRLPATDKSDAAITALKNAYRNVVSATYAKSEVTGKSISDSSSAITLLWVLPMIVSSLVLVILPCLLLMRSLVQRMFVDEFSSELMLSMGGAVSFVWGATGALACLAFVIAREAKNKRYTRGANKGVAIRAIVGALLGLGVFLIFSLTDLLGGLERDIAVGLLSFLFGAASSGAVGYFEKNSRGHQNS